MARRKAEEKRTTDEGESVNSAQADRGSIAIGGIRIDGDFSGSFTIGFTAEQVSLLLAQFTSKVQRKPFDGRCPYRGLKAFEEEDADLFFGRERLVEDLLGRVKESRTVFITGPSGSGKSSLARAGLIHALKGGAIQDLHSERWLYETLKPGREPLKDLALAFSRLKGPDLADYFEAHVHEAEILNKCAESVLSGRKDQRFVLFVDQFEEVFTQVNQETERLAFLNMLAQAVTAEEGRVILLFAMRSDFLSNCAPYPQLNALINQSRLFQVGAMQPEELVSAIALPAIQVGLPIEDELIARIINDMKGEPGALPLMQFALKDLFDSKKGGVIALRLEDYLRHGGIQKSLARHADDSFAKLNASEQNLASSIFSGLIEIGRGTQDTRRTALFDELVPANTKPEDVLAIVSKLADARLVITDEQAGKDTVTISHETLIDAWPWLKKLVNENRDVIALQNEIINDAKEWEEHRRDASYLYSGARLANAREQLEAHKILLSEAARAFIEAGSRAHADELEAARQRANQLRLRSLYLSIALGAALIAVGLAVFYALQSRYQTKVSRAGELVAQSMVLRERNFQTSLLLAIEAFRSGETLLARGALLDDAYANPQLDQFLIGSKGRVISFTFSSDGKMLASGGDDGTIVLWDMQSRQPIGQPFKGHTGSVWSIAFSPDNTMLASASADNTSILWDVASHQKIAEPLKGQTGLVVSVAFSPDGKTLALAGKDIILWDVSSRQQIGQALTGHTDMVVSVAFSPDGKTLASRGADKTIILWDVPSRAPIGPPLKGHLNSIGYTISAGSLAFSPDGKTLASAADNIILWDLLSVPPVGKPLIGQLSNSSSIAFSPDGRTLVSGHDDHTVRFWDVASRGQIREPLTVHTSLGVRVAFSPDGKTIASSSFDGTFILWDITARQRIDQPLPGLTSEVNGVAFSPDGKILASGSVDNIILWDVPSRQQIDPPLEGHTSSVHSLAFSPNGKTLASGSEDKTIILWDVASRRPIGQPLTGHTRSITSVAFSPDSKLLASGGEDGVLLWDVPSRKLIGQLVKERTASLAFSPDGKTLAVGGEMAITLWDVASRGQIGPPLEGHTGPVHSVAFSPDGKTLASGSGDGDNIIMLWDLSSTPPIRQPLRGHTELVVLFGVAFSPDGKTVASVGGNELILWDVASRQPIGQTLVSRIGAETVTFSPDGKLLASGGRTLVLWDLDPSSWTRKSCQRAGGNFTLAEWKRYFPTESYRKTCEQWPLETEATPPEPTEVK